MSDSGNKVFISYAREDKELAQRLYKDLKALGFDVWLDVKQLKGGQKWDTAIRRAIKESRFFLAILSSNSVKKKGYVQKELREALDEAEEYPESEIYIIPVRLDDCDPGFEDLHKLNWVDMFPSWEDGVKRIALSLNPDSDERLLDEILTPNSPTRMDSPEAYIRESGKYLGINPRKAKQIITEGLSKYPDNRNFLGVAALYLAYKLDAVQEAAKIYDKMIKLWPDDAKVNFNIAKFLWKRRGEVKKARRYFSVALKEQGIVLDVLDKLDLYSVYADFLEEVGGTEEQIAEYRKKHDDLYEMIEEGIGWSIFENIRPRDTEDRRLDRKW